MQELALKTLKQATSEFHGDPARLYLTGLSMGGYGSWAIARNNPGMFAAIGVICGGVRRPPNVPVPPNVQPEDPGVDPYEAVAEKVGKTPVWVFHGGADPIVPVGESRKMVEAIKAAGGEVRYTEYDGVGHNSWDKAFAEPDFFKWLLDKKNRNKKRSKWSGSQLTGTNGG
jgi:predicted peptidase